jgi:hypothetical protein
MTMRNLISVMIAMFFGSIAFFLFPLIALAILGVAVVVGGAWLMIPVLRTWFADRLGTRGVSSSGFYARPR